MDISGLFNKTLNILKSTDKTQRIIIAGSGGLLVLLLLWVIFRTDNLSSHAPKYFWTEPASVYYSALTNSYKPKDLPYEIRTIEKGDNYWTLANEAGTDIDTIYGCNPFLRSLYASIGEHIVIIKEKGVLHYTSENESVKKLAKLYGIPASDIRERNHTGLFGKLQKGDIFFIPEVNPKILTESLYAYYRLRHKFINPIHGWIGGHYGWRIHPVYKERRFHKGIDLGGPKNSTIYASADGKVTFTGEAGGYGKLIIIKHDENFETYYAHNSRIFVRRGQRVKQGDPIARMGKTGVATVAHLHFEVRSNGEPMNPLKVLW